MVEVAENLEVPKIWWWKWLKTLKCWKSDGWRSVIRWRMQNLIVEITENIELRKIWSLGSCIKPWSTQNPMVEVRINRLKYAKSDGWSCPKHWSNKIWWSTLKTKSDGWSCLEKNLMLEDARKIEGCKIWWLKLSKHWSAHNLKVEDH